ncbi:MAG: hypothetical protein GY804_08805 [Alphaproteobacteria bacterium]|nr:hypothetical protein [Alphaproteobacteria bacterium]
MVLEDMGLLIAINSSAQKVKLLLNVFEDVPFSKPIAYYLKQTGHEALFDDPGILDRYINDKISTATITNLFSAAANAYLKMLSKSAKEIQKKVKGKYYFEDVIPVKEKVTKLSGVKIDWESFDKTKIGNTLQPKDLLVVFELLMGIDFTDLKNVLIEDTRPSEEHISSFTDKMRDLGLIYNKDLHQKANLFPKKFPTVSNAIGSQIDIKNYQKKLYNLIDDISNQISQKQKDLSVIYDETTKYERRVKGLYSKDKNKYSYLMKDPESTTSLATYFIYEVVGVQYWLTFHNSMRYISRIMDALIKNIK